jgi:predicted NAD-dependent protein-ADP-ribosyltransferase YbiA (DUF1768 family)
MYYKHPDKDIFYAFDPSFPEVSIKVETGQQPRARLYVLTQSFQAEHPTVKEIMRAEMPADLADALDRAAAAALAMVD